MKKLTWLLFAVFIVLFSSSCAVQYKNKYTGEIRNDRPKYPECQRDTPEKILDRSCYTEKCLNGKYTLKSFAAATLCEDTCMIVTGRTVKEDDWNCNYQRSKKEGWE